MSFVSFSTLLDGIGSLKNLKDEDTYITVFSSSYMSDTQRNSLNTIRTTCNVLYEGPPCFNHYHSERNEACQFILVFEKKCQQEPNPAQNVLNKDETPEVTT